MQQTIESSTAILFDSAKVPFSLSGDQAKTMTDATARARYIRAFGEEFRFKRLCRLPGLRLTYCSVPPGDHAPPHRHGSVQITYVLKGGLKHGARFAGPGMGYFNPNRLYSWTAGPEGAEFLEAHDEMNSRTIFQEEDDFERRDAEGKGLGLKPFVYDSTEIMEREVAAGVTCRDIIASPTLAVRCLQLKPGAHLRPAMQDGPVPINYLVTGSLEAAGEIAEAGMGVQTGDAAPDWRAGAQGATIICFADQPWLGRN